MLTFAIVKQLFAMKLFSVLKQKWFWINLLLLIVFYVIVVWGAFVGLNIYTNHNEYIKLPSFVGKTEKEVQQLCKQYKLRYVITDSIYDSHVKPGAVVEQIPKPGVNVKENRKIFLTINAIGPEKIAMPDLTGISVREAAMVADIYGIKIGNLKFVPDIAKNNILKQMYKGAEIKPGTLIPKGSVIDLVVGTGISNEKTFVPCLYGLTYDQAEQVLTAAALNVGAVIYDETVKNAKDSAVAKVYKQNPEFRVQPVQLNLGYSVDIWLTADSTMQILNCDSLKLLQTDTLGVDTVMTNIETDYDL